MSKLYLTQDDMKRLYPKLTPKQHAERGEAIALFTELFFECIQKKMRYNELGNLV